MPSAFTQMILSLSIIMGWRGEVLGSKPQPIGKKKKEKGGGEGGGLE